MKKILGALLILSTISYSIAQDNSAASYCYGNKTGIWVQLDEVLAGTRYLGNSERIELELSGGSFSAFGRVTYLIEARNGLEVKGIRQNGHVDGHELVIYDNGEATNSSNKYIIGIRVQGGSWYSICIRSRELVHKRWLNMVSTTEPTLTEVTPEITWLYRSESNGDFIVDNNVGIGTNNPSAKLDVKGSAAFKDGNIVDVVISTPGGKNGIALSPNKYGNYSRFDIVNFDNPIPASRYFRFKFNEDASGLTIRKGGNVGIGTTFPSEKLVVDGKILAEEVKVQNVPASDYVFEPDYDLKPIEEVEAFVKENKHLPDIPSAEEFKENGVGLGEMDDMLLRKVEELTLYVIELKKSDNEKLKLLKELREENEELKDIVSSQNSRIKRLEYEK